VQLWSRNTLELRGGETLVLHRVVWQARNPTVELDVESHSSSPRVCTRTIKRQILYMIDSGLFGLLSWYPAGRVATRADDAQGSPTQSHISPSILVYEDKGAGIVPGESSLLEELRMLTHQRGCRYSSFPVEFPSRYNSCR